jgi:hypothetical protein
MGQPLASMMGRTNAIEARILGHCMVLSTTKGSTFRPLLACPVLPFSCAFLSVFFLLLHES